VNEKNRNNLILGSTNGAVVKELTLFVSRVTVDFSRKLEAHTLMQIKYSLTIPGLNVSSFLSSALSLVLATV